MNKKEILEKAQAESVDEGLENAQNKGRAWGVAAFTIVYIAITIFNTVTDKPNHLASMFFMAYLAAGSIPEYMFTKKKIYLATAIISALAAILNLINYIMG